MKPIPDFAEPVIGRAYARPVGSSGLHSILPISIKIVSSVLRTVIPAKAGMTAKGCNATKRKRD